MLKDMQKYGGDKDLALSYTRQSDEYKKNLVGYLMTMV